MLGKYETGQLFLHRIFGYRGVILFPWLAQVYDRDLPATGSAAAAALARQSSVASSASTTTATGDDTAGGKTSDKPLKDSTTGRLVGQRSTTASNDDDDDDDETTTTGLSNVKGKTNTFYQVLIDSRDCPYIVSACNIFFGN